jgi:two-component system LytT family response regulator
MLNAEAMASARRASTLAPPLAGVCLRLCAEGECMNVRTLIASGSESTRSRLRSLLSAYEWLDCGSEHADGHAALSAIGSERPDLLFVDVDLPGIDGIELMGLGGELAEVILLSADEKNAAAAFEAGALDYLTKPVEASRLAKSMARVRRRVASPNERPAKRLFLRLNKELIQVGSDEVSRIEACGDYVNVHARGDRHLIHLSLKEMQKRVDPEKFLQIHRSHIINLDHVVSLRPYDDRRFMAALSDGSTVVASRAGTRLLKRLTLD